MPSSLLSTSPQTLDSFPVCVGVSKIHPQVHRTVGGRKRTFGFLSYPVSPVFHSFYPTGGGRLGGWSGELRGEASRCLWEREQKLFAKGSLCETEGPLSPHPDVAGLPPVCQALSNTLPQGDLHWHFKGLTIGPDILEISIGCPFSILPNKGLRGSRLSVITTYEMEGHFGTRIVRRILF